MDINAITVCVEYDDYLRLTLPRILQHVKTLTVVTAPKDQLTQSLVAEYPQNRVKAHVTDAFYRDGANFNKGRALEEGFDAMGRKGWILILDADIVLPQVLPRLVTTCGKIYGVPRRIMSNLSGLANVDTINWQSMPLRSEGHNYGYFQLFHAEDPIIAKHPWYETDWTHAGGADNNFKNRWHVDNRARLPFDVIHLGDPDQNWYGRVQKRVDTGEQLPEAASRKAKLTALHRRHGWVGQKRTGETVVERIKKPTDTA